MFNEFHHQVRGRGHEQEGTLGQDRTAYLSRNGVQVLCLADGAGSATHSAFGAQAVVAEGCALLVEEFAALDANDDAPTFRRQIVDRLQTRLERVTVRLGCTTPDLASTFLAVAVSAERFLVVHIGDGVIGFIKDGALRVLSSPENAEFANQTTFVTSPNAASSTRLFRGSVDDVTGFILMSDGSSASLYDHRLNKLAPACSKIIEVVSVAPTRQVRSSEHKRRLKRLVDTKLRQATKDDCSIGVLAKRR